MLVKLGLVITTLMLGVAPLPQPEYRGNNKVVVTFVTDANTKAACGEAPKDWYIIACAGVNKHRMILPNPCQFKDDAYARVVCHELGHTNGWPADHPNPAED